MSEEIEKLVDDLNAALENDASFEKNRDINLEDLAYRISKAPGPVAQDAVQKTVSHTTNDRSRSNSQEGPRLLAWLLLYRVIDPVLLLETVVLTKDTSMLEICGTSQFADDVIEHLRLSESKGFQPQFPVTPRPKTIFIDLLHSRNESQRRSMPKPYEPPSMAPSPPKPTKPSVTSTASQFSVPASNSEQLLASTDAKKAKPDFQAYESRIRKIILSSMSAEEILHKILNTYIKNSEDSVANTIFKTCCESKMYNRIHGNVAIKLCRNNERLWKTALNTCFLGVFKHGCEQMDVDPLKVAGCFFGHLLSANALDWKNTFGNVTLDVENSTPSNRILFLAILEELRVSIGAKAVESRILSSEMSGYTDGVLKTELASGFWDLAGFKVLSETAHQFDIESDS